MTLKQPDVIVAGGGNAGICAAISAAEAGASVILLESDPVETRGGNSKYTRNIRCATDAYPEDELLADLIAVTGEGIDRELAAFAIRTSRSCPEWMESHGVRWQPALRGTLQLGRTNRFFLGGGKALLNTYYRDAAKYPIEVRYGARAIGIELDDAGTFAALRVMSNGIESIVRAGAFVAAAGGYESNRAWLGREWGEAASNFVIRGTSSNDGHVLQTLFDLGAEPCGNPRGFHAIAVDARSPLYDGGIATRVDSLPLGIVVNRDAQRFYDEGEDIWPKRYAIWGRLIAEQPEQIAYSIYDAHVQGCFVPACFPPVRADTIGELATELGLDSEALASTIATFNAHVSERPIDRSRLDGCGTTEITPPKSNWAQAIREPPFYAYPVRPGITFTFLGVRVNERAEVLRSDGNEIPGVFGAGEIISGNLLTNGYLGGFGMTIGTVFGRLAGSGAAHHARHRSSR